MIIDKLENLAVYRRLNPLIEDVLDYLAHQDLRQLPNGRHVLGSPLLFVNVEDDRGKSRDEAVIEFHRRMIDIQIPLNTAETYGYTPVVELPPVAFDEDNDIAKVPGVRPREFVTAHPGEFVMFFPQDGHAPCIAPTMIHKAVFKVAVVDE